MSEYFEAGVSFLLGSVIVFGGFMLWFGAIYNQQVVDARPFLPSLFSECSKYGEVLSHSAIKFPNSISGEGECVVLTSDNRKVKLFFELSQVGWSKTKGGE